MGVLSTRSLLGALGISSRRTGEASAAINWVVKDGVGKLSRLLFARWGRALDCELKQFRFAGNIMMEASHKLPQLLCNCIDIFHKGNLADSFAHMHTLQHDSQFQ